MLVLVVRFVLLRAITFDARQRLFSLRRDLLWLVFDGHVSEALPAFRLMYRNINAAICYTERFTFVRVFMYVWLAKPPKDTALQQSILIAPDEARDRLVKIRERLDREIARHMILSSPTGWLFWIVASLARIARAVTSSKPVSQDVEDQLAARRRGPHHVLEGG